MLRGRRSVATLPGHHCGRAPRNKGMRYPADPPTVEEIILVMRHAGDRARAAVARADRGHVARGLAYQRDARADRERREVGMDQWGWDLLRPWLAYRVCGRSA
jgi:hypothetical protein